MYGLSADPCNPSVFASACDDGRLLIFDIRDSTAGLVLSSMRNCSCFNAFWSVYRKVQSILAIIFV